MSKDQDGEEEFEVKMFFDDDTEDVLQNQRNKSSTTTANNSKNLFVLTDHFSKKDESVPSRRPMHSQSVFIDTSSEKKPKQQQHQTTSFDDDGFSSIFEDTDAIKLRRQRMASQMAKSEIGFRVVNQDDSDLSRSDRSTTGFNMSVLESSSASAGGGSESLAIDLKIDLPATIKTYTEAAYQKSSDCQICFAPFTMTNRQHHCRYCAKSVCQTCSNKMIQKLRCCDICFITVNLQVKPNSDNPDFAAFKSMIQGHNNYITNVEKYNTLLTEKIEFLNTRDEEMDNKVWNLQKANSKERHEKLEIEEKKIVEANKDRQHLISMKTQMTDVADKKEQHLEEKRNQLYELQRQLRRLKEDNLMKQETLNSRQLKLDVLNTQWTKMQAEVASFSLIEQSPSQTGTKTMQASDEGEHVQLNQFVNQSHFRMNRQQLAAMNSSGISAIDDTSSVLIHSNLPMTEKERVAMQYINQMNASDSIKSSNQHESDASEADANKKSDFEPKSHNVAGRRLSSQLCLNNCEF